jgi:hypothetical protein
MARAGSITMGALLCASVLSGLGTRPAGRAPASARVRLVPQFTPGETLRYQFDLRTETTSHSTGPIDNPEGPSKLELSIRALVRLEVLHVETISAGARVRLRTTYEKSSASSQSDAFDPQEAALEDQYRKLEGHSIEFTLEPDGKVSDVSGLKEILPSDAAAGHVREWMAGLAQASTLPREGISIGQKWSAEHPVESAPIAGLVWRTESTYLRNEPCRAPSAQSNAGDSHRAAPAAVPEDTCAIILTKFAMDDRKVPRDPTPDEYRRNSLRTSGKWTGSGESLNAISLRTGLVVSVTQTGTEEMDVTVASATSTSRMHYAGRIHSESQITLLPPEPAALTR